MFYDPHDFPFIAAFEQNWRRIYDEFRAVGSELTDYVETDLYDNGWETFFIYRFPHGEIDESGVAKCPFTASLVHENVPNHGTAGFSVLLPNANIKPHKGYQGQFLRCHLALKVPEGDCALSVEGEERKWEAGKVIVFDDRVEHAAWNRADTERAVLLFDFVPDQSLDNGKS